MGRFAPGVAALAIAAAALTPVPARSLATLHVSRFSIAADRTSVRAGEAFHLTMSARVDEPVTELNDVTLPDLAGIDVSGDERRCSASAHGSDCSETLTLAATTPGDRTLGPWLMDAVDARNHRPSRFSSNVIVIHVAGPSPLESFGGTLRDLGIAALSALVALALAGAVVWAVLRMLGRPRARTAAPAFAPPPLPAQPMQRAMLRDLVEALAREPTRAHAIAVREALRESIGAGEAETHADLVARRAIDDPTALAAFSALEHAAFCENARVAGSAREALSFLMR